MPAALLRQWPPGKPILLDNRTCVYCGTDLHAGNDTKEHVIARNFVPKGKFDGQWNLIVRACRDCNKIKAELEDDISAITMQPSVSGEYAVDDDVLRREADRKGTGSQSRWTRKAVAESYEETAIDGTFGGATFTFGLEGLPVITSDRLGELALLQM